MQKPKICKTQKWKNQNAKGKKNVFFQNKNFLLARKLLGDNVGFMPIF